jgi:hypothetical protein
MRLIKHLTILALFTLTIHASIQQTRGREVGFANRSNAGVTANAQGKISILKFDARSLSAEIRYQGKIVDGARWTDSNGENILVLTQTDKFPTKGKKNSEGEDPSFDAEVYAYNYVIKGGKTLLLWKITDFMRDCAFDLYAGFMKETLSITDLDSNGIAESSFLYKLSCRSDVSPDGLKLIMHEGATKYAIRGTTKLPPEYGGGEMNLDPAFKQANDALRNFAVEQWNKNVTRYNSENFY